MASATRLVIAFDGSAGAGAALRAAGQLFPGEEAVIVLVRDDHALLEHAAFARLAMPDEVIRAGARAREREAATARQLLAAAERIAADAGLDWSTDLRASATPWRAVADAADDHDADVVVCGSRGLGQFSRALLGSTSSALLRHCPRATLIVPHGDGSLDGPLVLGYDGSDGARAAIAFAAERFPGRDAIVVHGWSSPISRSFNGAALAAVPIDDVQDVTDDLTELLAAQALELAEEGAALAAEAGLSARGIEFECAPVAWRALTAVARREGASAIVAGSRGRGAVLASVLGSVSSGLAHHAETPVLIVR